MTDSSSLSQPQSLLDGVPADSLPLDDRGLLYGDGLFETMRFDQGQAPLWRWHMQRLMRGCEHLMLEAPDESLLLKECLKVAGEQSRVVRLLLTRGSAQRPGYASRGVALPRRIVMGLTLPCPRAALRVGLCRQPMAQAGVTAGMKHLARLEQVLLAREMTQGDWDEGLVFDQAGHLCEALQSNVLLKKSGDHPWITPPVGAGVAGTTRAALLELGLIEEQRVTRSELSAFQSMALCNAVRGVEAVTELVGVGLLDVHPAEAVACAWRQQLMDMTPKLSEHADDRVTQ